MSFKYIILGGLTSTILILGYFRIHQQILDWQERQDLTIKRRRRQKKREIEFNLLENDYPLTEECEKILCLDFESLRQKLLRRELSAMNVLKAYVAKAVRVTKEFNCVTEFVPQMWELAEELDKLPHVKGPLHGVIFCVKEDNDIEGMDTTLGYSRNLDKPAMKTCVMVQILMDGGGIPMCKGNLPQTVFSISSDNPIFGTTVNHLNKLLSPGGSSSGSACLVGAGGAVFATGTDLGGSLRVPAHMSGLVSLRPTLNRMSRLGIVQPIEGLAGIAGVPGILAQRAETLAKIFEIQTTRSLQNEYDPVVPPIPWNASLYNSEKPLRIGYFTSLPLFPSLGDTPLTVMAAKEALQTFGHSLFPFEIPDNWHLLKVFASLELADGCNQIYRKLKNDQVSMAGQKFLRGRTFLSYLDQVFGSIFRSKGKREFNGDEKASISAVLWDYLSEQERIKYKILELMQQKNLDLILSPVFPFPACRLQYAEIMLNAHVYTAIWNLVDFPAGVVPFGHETCTRVDDYDDEGDFYLRLAKEGIKHARGMPIGVQVIGQPYKEEMVLRVLVQLDNSFRNT